MTRTHEQFRAPWRKGHALSCTVFDAEGGVVASIFARTHDEQAKRLHLVKAAPAMLSALKRTVELLENGAEGAIVDTVWHTDYETLRDLLASVIEEAEPV